MSEMNEKELLEKEIAELEKKYEQKLEMWDDCMLMGIGGSSIVEQIVHNSLTSLENQLEAKRARLRELSSKEEL